MWLMNECRTNLHRFEKQFNAKFNWWIEIKKTEQKFTTYWPYCLTGKERNHENALATIWIVVGTHDVCDGCSVALLVALSNWIRLLIQLHGTISYGDDETWKKQTNAPVFHIWQQGISMNATLFAHWIRLQLTKSVWLSCKEHTLNWVKCYHYEWSA